MLTLEDLERIPTNMLTAAQVAPFIGSDPHTIRIAAHTRPDLLGFPVVVMGSRVKIPKELFVKYFRGKEDSYSEE